MSVLDKYVSRHGPAFKHLALTVYINFYFSEIEILDLCGRWIPQRSDTTEKMYLVKHASDEVAHANAFKKGVESLGIEWNDELIATYRIGDINDRFDRLHKSDDELAVLVGLNLYAEGVLAMEELVQLGRNLPEIFPDFDRIAREEQTHVAFGKAVLKRRLADNSSEHERLERLLLDYQTHMLQYLWGDISDKLDLGIQFGALDPDYRENTLYRFSELAQQFEVNLQWHDSRRPVAPNY